MLCRCQALLRDESLLRVAKSKRDGLQLRRKRDGQRSGHRVRIVSRQLVHCQPQLGVYSFSGVDTVAGHPAAEHEYR